MTLVDVAVLEFERQTWRLPGSKEQAIRETFGWSPTRHAQRLQRILDDPRALEVDAQLVRRLQRLRSRRLRQRGHLQAMSIDSLSK